MPRRGSLSVALVASVAFLVLAVVVVGGGAWLFAQEMDARKDRKKIADLDAAIEFGLYQEKGHADFERQVDSEEHIKYARDQREAAIARVNESIAERNAIVGRRPEFGLKEMQPRTVNPVK